MGSTLGPRRLRTETWSLGVERRFLALLTPLVPHKARVYVALGFVLFEVYATDRDGKIDLSGPEPRRTWAIAYVGRQTRNLP